MLFASIFNGDHIVSAPAVVEGALAQVIAAPIAGFVKTAEVRAGDKVEEGQVMATLKAPFTGYVTSGDLSQSLGAPVDIGDVLFEVAPAEEYKVVVKVDESDMAGVDNDKTGKVVIAALPSDPIPFEVDQVIPLAISGEGNSYFRIEAAFEQATPDLRPGMEGVARIDMGERKLIWIWTHKLVDKIRLWLWSVGW